MTPTRQRASLGATGCNFLWAVRSATAAGSPVKRPGYRSFSNYVSRMKELHIEGKGERTDLHNQEAAQCIAPVGNDVWI